MCEGCEPCEARPSQGESQVNHHVLYRAAKAWKRFYHFLCISCSNLNKSHNHNDDDNNTDDDDDYDCDDDGDDIINIEGRLSTGIMSCYLITVAQKCHGNFNLLTAISICSRQFQFAHGNFNLLTAISICSRQFQFAHGNFSLLTAISICSRQFQFAHGNFNLLISHGNWPPRGAWTRELGRGTLGKFLPRVVLEVRLRDS